MGSLPIHGRQSMLPLIEPKDKLIVEKASEYQINDIVTFIKNGRLIAHRVIYKRADGSLITKGDNNLKSDGVITKDKVLGNIEKIKREEEEITLSHIYLLQSSTYLKELKKIKKAFDKADISFLILKGLPLHLYYGKKSPDRIYYDCDILVKKPHFKKATNILESLEFHIKSSVLFDKKTPSTQYSLIKKTKPFPVVIDLHLEPAIGLTKTKAVNKLIPNIKRFTNNLFKKKEVKKVEGTEFNILKKEVFIAYLLLHLYHHNFKGAHRINFIKKVTNDENVDWSATAELVKKYGFENFVYPSALVVNRLYENCIPNSFLKEVAPNSYPKYLGNILSKTISPFEENGRLASGVQRFIFLVLLSPKNLLQKTKVILNKKVLSHFFSTIRSFFSSSFKKLSTSSSAFFRDTS